MYMVEFLNYKDILYLSMCKKCYNKLYSINNLNFWYNFLNISKYEYSDTKLLKVKNYGISYSYEFNEKKILKTFIKSIILKN